MIVKMRLKPSMLGKLPGKRVKDKQMRVAEYVVKSEWQDFEITEDNVHHIESVGTLHWCEIDAGSNIIKQIVNDELDDELDDELEGELVEGNGE